jgi:hypothetical protein
MDVIASLGFGMDTDSQTNPESAFIKYAKELFNFRFTPLMFLIGECRITLQIMEVYICEPPRENRAY